MYKTVCFKEDIAVIFADIVIFIPKVLDYFPKNVDNECTYFLMADA
jgi:hypothetical protein